MYIHRYISIDVYSIVCFAVSLAHSEPVRCILLSLRFILFALFVSTLSPSGLSAAHCLVSLVEQMDGVYVEQVQATVLLDNGLVKWRARCSARFARWLWRVSKRRDQRVNCVISTSFPRLKYACKRQVDVYCLFSESEYSCKWRVHILLYCLGSAGKLTDSTARTRQSAALLLVHAEVGSLWNMCLLHSSRGIRQSVCRTGPSRPAEYGVHSAVH
jgi:hypothetical protein